MFIIIVVQKTIKGEFLLERVQLLGQIQYVNYDVYIKNLYIDRCVYHAE